MRHHTFFRQHQAVRICGTCPQTNALAAVAAFALFAARQVVACRCFCVCCYADAMLRNVVCNIKYWEWRNSTCHIRRRHSHRSHGVHLYGYVFEWVLWLLLPIDVVALSCGVCVVDHRGHCFIGRNMLVWWWLTNTQTHICKHLA